MLLSFRTGSSKPIIQVEQKFSLYKLCVFTTVPPVSPTAKWLKLIWENKVKIQNNSKKYLPLAITCEYDTKVIEREFIMHSKLMHNSITICTKMACKNFKYDNSWIQMNDYFYNILNILSDRNNAHYLVVQKLNTQKLYENLLTFKFTDEVKCIQLNDSVKQCVHMQIKSNGKTTNYISPCKIRTQID